MQVDLSVCLKVGVVLEGTHLVLIVSGKPNGKNACLGGLSEDTPHVQWLPLAKGQLVQKV